MLFVLLGQQIAKEPLDQPYKDQVIRLLTMLNSKRHQRITFIINTSNKYGALLEIEESDVEEMVTSSIKGQAEFVQRIRSVAQDKKVHVQFMQAGMKVPCNTEPSYQSILQGIE